MATFVLVHGGGHGAWCWERLAPLLQRAGHQVHTPTLTGVGERFGELTAEVGLSTHIDDIASVMQEQDLENVILVGHSYGCMVITGVAGRLPGRIAQLVFLDGPHPRDGESLADASGGVRDVLEPAKREVDGVELILFPTPELMDIFGLRTPEDVSWAAEHLTPHPWRSLIEPLRLENPEAMRALPRASIDCIESGNRRYSEMVDRSKEADRRWEIDTGHDLMITEPLKVSEILLELVGIADEPPKR